MHPRRLAIFFFRVHLSLEFGRTLKIRTCRTRTRGLRPDNGSWREQQMRNRWGKNAPSVNFILYYVKILNQRTIRVARVDTRVIDLREQGTRGADSKHDTRSFYHSRSTSRSIRCDGTPIRNPQGDTPRTCRVSDGVSIGRTCLMW